MKIDPVYLQRHYASLSDDALLAVDREDLVEAARQIYDAEIADRGLDAANLLDEMSDSTGDDPEFESTHSDLAPAEDGDAPEWLDEAAEVWSCVVHPGRGPAPEAADARAVLLEAGIPCHLELQEILPEETANREVRHHWRLMVPGNLNLRATSELDREIFNEDFETEWKAHLEVFSDTELRTMHPHVAFGGLFDKVERITRAYNEELARRRLA